MWALRRARGWLTAELRYWGGSATLFALYEAADAAGLDRRALEAAVDRHVECGMARRVGWGTWEHRSGRVPPVIELTPEATWHKGGPGWVPPEEGPSSNPTPGGTGTP